ncbi:phosphotransferase family protein [Peribacillus sp. B-H-3]|uniref:phosphotransferase family protein n=1 Tax=Peribacillus sp. B-H-3 TaxID=3400420 RepID=UPI003B029B28
MTSDVIPVKKGEELDSAKLEDYLKSSLKDLPDSPLVIEQFNVGRSNLTYSLKAGDWEGVLRRPPLGHLAPKAHDVEREYHILKEIQPHFPAAPKPFLFADPSLLGYPFFIMERKHGVVLDTGFPDNSAATPELCRFISRAMVDSLGSLHSINYKRTKLPEMTKPDGFLERQVHGWISRYHRAATDEIPGALQLMDWLASHIPISQEPVVIHYDYKLNNAMFNEDLTEMIGLFDWEMATVGDPLADLGAAMSYWIQHDDPPLLKKGLGDMPITAQPGFLSRDEFIKAYSKKTGRDVSDMNFYLTFAYFKLAVICQQIYFRWKKGQTLDVRFANLNVFVKTLIQHACHVSSNRI